MAGISHLIINSAYREPEKHWEFNALTQSFELVDGRRSAGYVIASEERSGGNQMGKFVELPVVNEIRRRVKKWREGGYKGTTAVTQKLLKHWHDESLRQYPFYFCQLDAIETLIWWTEAPSPERQGIHLGSDGSAFERICTKMCTGSGKTTVMGMLIAWMVCNKVAYPQDKRFTKYVLIVAPGLTVRNRLYSLKMGGIDNEYVNFEMVPSGMMDMLHQGKVHVINWQAMEWETQEDLDKKKSVDKRGPKSDEAYARGVLGDIARYKSILVINDEAHHAWRKNPESKVSKAIKEAGFDEEEATVWIGGLDRINNVRNIIGCYDFSATPFAPNGKKNDEEALFTWIISDFGLNDGIESGLVKTPRVAVRDDATPEVIGDKLYSKLYHVYQDDDVRHDINRSANPEEPLPDLIRQGYLLLGKDWERTFNAWKEAGSKVPPVMISVANRTETAARIKYMFESKDVPVPALCEPEYLVQIDSKLLKSLNADDGKSKQDKESELREMVNTVGKVGKPGEQIRNVISVGMLSEGWDARTVTHIFGLRAFSSQLLCEQVIGRGLRRTTYDVQEDNPELFAPEYVNIFGIPFSFLPHEEDEGGNHIVKPKTQIEVIPSRKQYEITWPNIIRFDTVYKQKLSVDFDKIPPLVLDASNVVSSVEMAPVLNGQTDISKMTSIELEKLYPNVRIQSIIFDAAGKAYKALAGDKEWAKTGTQYSVLGQIVKLTETFINSDKIIIEPLLFSQDELRRRIMLIIHMSRIVRHLCDYIEDEWTEKLVPVYDTMKPVLSTGDMATWFTSKPCMPTVKSHISHVVRDSILEETEAWVLENNPHVVAYAKNNHLGYDIPYVYGGVHHNYIPDFLIRLDNGKILVLETKGKMTDKDSVKRQYLQRWINAVNGIGTLGKWCCDISFDAKDVNGIIEKYCK